MLQYKFKHLCSRIIASLSAIGLFSISSNADAATKYKPGDSFTLTNPKAYTLNAEYESMTGLCMLTTKNGVDINATATFTPQVTGTSGETTTGYCLYTCKSDYGYYAAVGATGVTSFRIGVAEDSTDQVYPDKVCTSIRPTCEAVPSTYTGIASFELVKNSDDKYRCKVTCNDGYGISGSDTTTKYINNTYAGTNVNPTEKITDENFCSARKYKITFDCGAGATYGSTNAQTGTGYAAYNSSYTIPTTLCVKPHYSHTSWTGASSMVP